MTFIIRYNITYRVKTALSIFDYYLYNILYMPRFEIVRVFVFFGIFGRLLFLWKYVYITKRAATSSSISTQAEILPFSAERTDKAAKRRKPTRQARYIVKYSLFSPLIFSLSSNPMYTLHVSILYLKVHACQLIGNRTK